jgi:DNA-binding CsgD family transcriptional regulator
VGERGRVTARNEIEASWQRSVRAGLTPDHLDVPYVTDLEVGGLLARAAGPVLDQLADDLGMSAVSLVLTDDRGHLIDRRVSDSGLQSRLDRISLAPGFLYAEDIVGTNAIGTALEQRGPSFVDGAEHFAEALTTMSCAAAPIVDPRNGRVLGVVDLSCRASESSPLMLALAARAAREVELRLVDDARVAERIVLQRFLRARRGAKGALVFVDERTMITNAAADRLVGPADEAVLRESARRFLRGSPADLAELVLSGGAAVTMRVEPVLDGGVVLGALVRLDPLAAGEPASAARANRRFGWESLTDTERSVTGLVSQGLTNVQVAERLFLSRHTVDFHLRAIFRKLDVASRVDLTRLTVERENTALTPQ